MGLFGKIVTAAMIYVTARAIVIHINETVKLRKEAQE